MIQKRKPPWGMFFILLLLALAASYYIAGLFKLDDVTIQNYQDKLAYILKSRRSNGYLKEQMT